MYIFFCCSNRLFFSVWEASVKRFWRIFLLLIFSYEKAPFPSPNDHQFQQRMSESCSYWKATTLQIACHSFLLYNTLNGTHQETNHKLTTSVRAAVVLSKVLSTASFSNNCPSGVMKAFFHLQFTCHLAKTEILKKKKKKKMRTRTTKASSVRGKLLL